MKVIDEEAYYNKIKELNIAHYTGEISYYTQAPLREVEKKILSSIRPGSKILDLGCGSGRFSIGAAQFGHQVVGLDITSEAIGAAKNKAQKLNLNNVRFVVGDMTDIPFEDNEYDFVFCPRFSINAVATFRRRQKAVAEMLRVVKPEGSVYIESFNRFYLGRGLFFFLKNILRDIWRTLILTYCHIVQKPYTALLPGDIIYEANKVADASKGYAHLPTIFELKSLLPASVKSRFYSIIEIAGKLRVDPFKFFRYSIWILVTKPKKLTE